jgi:hypothetical protein
MIQLTLKLCDFVLEVNYVVAVELSTIPGIIVIA